MSQLQQTGEVGEPTPRRRHRGRRIVEDEKEESKIAIPEPGAGDMYNVNSREAFGHSRSNVPINDASLNYGIAINSIPHDYGRRPLGNDNNPNSGIPNYVGPTPNDNIIDASLDNNGRVNSPSNNNFIGSSPGENGSSITAGTSDGSSGLENLPFLVVGIEMDLAIARTFFRRHGRAITECLGVLHDAIAFNIDPRYLREDLYQTLNAIAQAKPSLEEGPFTALSNYLFSTIYRFVR